jgi:hypothetical protein
VRPGDSLSRVAALHAVPAAALAGYYQGEASVVETGWYDGTDDYVAAVFDLRWRFRDAPT